MVEAVGGAAVLIRQVDLSHLSAALLLQAVIVGYYNFAALLPTDAGWRKKQLSGR